MQMNLLRVCLHHGKRMVREPLSLEVVVNDEKVLVSEPAPPCSFPVWNFLVEQEVLASKVATVKVRVMSGSGFFANVVGSCAFTCSVKPFQREEVRLHGGSTGIFTCSAEADEGPVLVIAYQLGDPEARKTDLEYVADLNLRDLNRRVYHIHAEPRTMSFHTPMPSRVSIKVALVKLSKDSDAAPSVITAKQTRGLNNMPGKLGQKVDRTGEFFFEESAALDWELYENGLGLDEYKLQLEAFLSSDGHERCLGRWHESLKLLLDSIEENGLKLNFRAILHEIKGTKTSGEVEILLDINEADMPSKPPPLPVEHKSMLTAKRGKFSAGLTVDTFYVHVGATGLNASSPFLKVRSDRESRKTHEFQWSEAYPNMGYFSGGFEIRTSTTSSRTTLEVYSDHSQTQLLGKVVLLETSAERLPLWRHMYGAARHATLEEEADEMAHKRRTPSTYQGSLYISFSRFSGHIRGMIGSMVATRKHVRLRARLLRGMYLLRYKNTRVKVLIRVPGCYAHGSEDVLCFPAEVDEEGLASFQDEGSEGSEGSEKFVDMDMTADAGTAYVYVVREGQEGWPPEVFGQLPILKDPKTFHEVHWVRLSCDRSVVSVGEDWQEFAGFFSGTSTLEQLEAPLSSKKAPASGWGCCAQPEEVEEYLEEIPADPAAPLPAKPAQLASTLPALTGKFAPVYCHVDVLAARSLPTADPDGLADPIFELQVENLVARSVEGESAETRKTLNPTFLQRVVLGPLQIAVDADGQLEAQQLPPIVLRMLDKDDVRSGGLILFSSYEVMGQAVITDAQILEAKPGEKQDLNHLHVAKWYGLRSDVRKVFEPGSLNPTWARRPRVLLAAAFSLSRDVQSVGPASQEAVQRIYTQEVKNYKIKLDLLGMRALQHADVHGLELSMPSFCSGYTTPTLLPVTDNFTGNYDPALVHAFASKVGDFIPVRVESEGESFENFENAADFTIEKNEPVGWSISVPFEGPVIPYLQPRRGALTSPAAACPPGPRGLRVIYEKPFVLLPDVVLMLTAQGTDEGSASVSLPITYEGLDGRHQIEIARPLEQSLRACKVLEPWEPSQAQTTFPRMAVKKGDMVEVLRREPTGWTYGTKMESMMERRRRLASGAQHDEVQGWFPDWTIEYDPSSWTEKCVSQFAALPQDLKGLSRLVEQGNYGEAVYHCYIDVFAETSGLLTWNKEFVVGRSLTTQHLFTIEDKDSKHTSQYFNQGDWMLDARSLDEPFDWRATPVLHAERRNHVPLGPKRLLRNLKPVNFSGMRTRELKQHCRKQGYRLLSHQHMPEALNPGHFTHHDYSDNLHSFLRPVGHRIRVRQDRDSKFLARLRLGLPAHLCTRKLEVSITDTEKEKVIFKLELTGAVTVIRSDIKLVSLPPGHKPSTHMKKDGSCMLALPHGEQVTLTAAEARRSLKAIEEIFEQAKFDQESEAKENYTTNVLVIRFDRDGQVVWAAPELLSSWSEPGKLLFVVKLDSSDTLVPVRVPCFDLRFELETAWFPCKTLAGLHGVKSEQLKTVVYDSATLEEGDEDAASGSALEGPDGYWKPIPVLKHAFCCRLMKLKGTAKYDRPRTDSWFRSALEDTFPEIATLPLQQGPLGADYHFVKHFFLDKCMNLKKELVLDDKKVGLVKGHVDIDEVGEPVQAQVGTIPIERLWVKKFYVVDICLLTVRGVTEALQDPYLEVGIRGNEESFVKKHASLVHQDNPGCDFYANLSFEMMLPSSCEFIFRLYSSGIFGDTLVGENVLDIEDRHVAQLSKKLRQASNEQWLRENVSPESDIEVVFEEGEDSERAWLEPTLPNFRPYSKRQSTRLFDPNSKEDAQAFQRRLGMRGHSAIETWPLRGPEGLRTGALRLWMDVSSQEEVVPDVVFKEHKHLTFQLRVKLESVTGISLFRDKGQRNDAFVKLDFVAKSVGQDRVRESKPTEAHKWARSTASFCQLLIFEVTTPVQYCGLTVTLMDQDTIAGPEEIYASKNVPLEILAANAAQGERTSVAYDVVFDRHPQKHQMDQGRGFWCCRRAPRPKPPPKPATLHMELQMVTLEDAASQELPPEGRYATPQDRIDWASAAIHPVEFMKIFLGPKREARIKCYGLSCILTVICLALLGMTWLIMQILSPIV